MGKSEMENEEEEEEIPKKIHGLPSENFEIQRRLDTLGPTGFDIDDIKDPIQKQLSLEGGETREAPEKGSEGIEDLLDDGKVERIRRSRQVGESCSQNYE